MRTVSFLKRFPGLCPGVIFFNPHTPRPMNSFSQRLKAAWKQSLILPVIFFMFLPVLQYRLINWDDNTHVYQNRAVERLDADHVKLIFLGTVNDTYIPLTTLSFALEHHFIGFDPKFYHLDNLLLHLAVVFLIMHLGSLCGLSLAGRITAGFLFGIHPMHVESVAWVTARKDVLYALFYLLSIIQYCYYIQRQDRKALFFSVLFGFLSILAKPMALSLPLILWLMDWFLKRPLDRKVLLDKIPFVLFVPIVWFTYSLNKTPSVNSVLESVLIWLWSLAFYIKKFIAPVDLSPLYILPEPISILNPEYFSAVVIVLIFAGGVIYWRKNRWVVFATLYFFFSIFFLLRISDVAKNLGPSIVADRFMYLPSLGFCLLAGVVFDSYRRFVFSSKFLKVIIGAVFISVLIFFSVTAYRQVPVWKDSFSFWNFLIKKDPSIPVAYLNRGMIFGQSREYRAALQDLNRALELKPDYIEAFNNRGNVYSAMGENRPAIRDYTQAIKLQKSLCAHGGCEQANILTKVSSRVFREIPKHKVQLAQYLSNRGGVLFSEGDYPRALEDLKEAAQLNPYFGEVYFNRGLVYKGLTEFGLAVQDFSRVIKLNPKSTPAYFQRAAVYSQLNDMKKAVADIEKVLSYDPDNPEAYYYRSKVLAATGDYRLALENLFKARSLGYTIDDIEFARLQEAVKGAP